MPVLRVRVERFTDGRGKIGKDLATRRGFGASIKERIAGTFSCDDLAKSLLVLSAR
jgi:hypothetical protein